MVTGPGKKPNIIFLIMDAGRQDMFGCYGNTEGLSPNIDELASEGMVLKHHYAAGSGSAQAHVSIFSGQHSQRHKMVHNFCDVRSDITMMPKLLNKAGYVSYGHMKAKICPPAGYGELFGFNEMICPGDHGDDNNGDNKSAPKAGKQTSFRSLLFSRQKMKDTAKKLLGDRFFLRRDASLLDGKASLEYLLGKIRQNGKERPVFAYATLLHPHLPYYPPKSFVKKASKGKKIHALAYEIQRNLHAYANGNYGKAEEAMESVRMLYKGEVAYVDYLIGNFIRELKRENLLDNTILIVTSDHGEYLGEHQLLTHGNMVWEELYNIPCIIRYPEKIQAGSSFEYMSSGMDLFPTIIGLISEKGLLQGEVIDGRDIFETRDDWKDRFLVVDSPPAVFPERLKAYPKVLLESTIIYRALRTRDYKYIWQSNGREYLFKTRTEESESNNLIGKDRDPAVPFREKMIRYYENIDPEFRLDEYPVRFGKKAAKKIDNPFIREELKRLGYLN